jgi:hypothetical protein
MCKSFIASGKSFLVCIYLFIYLYRYNSEFFMGRVIENLSLEHDNSYIINNVSL